MNNVHYEEHGITGSEFPFIFHTDKEEKETHAYFNWHTNIEFLCCISGKGTVKCKSEEFEFKEGDIAVINSDVLHAVTSTNEVIYHCLIVDMSFFKINSIDIENLSFKEIIKDDELFLVFKEIAEKFEKKERFFKAEIKYLVLGFLMSLCKKHACETDSALQFDSPHSERIKNVIKYIKKNISSDLSLDKIAKAVDISKYHLTREFKKYTGCTVFEQVNIIRCNEAKRLIIDEDLSVSSAARSCGFYNMSYFTRTYKKYIGCLPSQSADE